MTTSSIFVKYFKVKVQAQGVWGMGGGGGGGKQSKISCVPGVYHLVVGSEDLLK